MPLTQVKHWREQLVTDSRQALREILDGPIRLTPTANTEYQFEAETTTGAFITGVIGPSTLCGVPNGIRD